MLWQGLMVAQSKTKKKVDDRGQSKDLSLRLSEMEKMLDLLLRASLRGRLLPADRKLIKDYLQSKKTQEKTKEKSREKNPSCPVCRGPLPNPTPDRCPLCSVLLPASKSKKKVPKKKKSKRK
jgi:hypothetical protein